MAAARRMTLDDSRLSMTFGAPSGRDRTSFGAPLMAARAGVKVAPPTTGKKEAPHRARLSMGGGAMDAQYVMLFVPGGSCSTAPRTSLTPTIP